MSNKKRCFVVLLKAVSHQTRLCRRTLLVSAQTLDDSRNSWTGECQTKMSMLSFSR